MNKEALAFDRSIFPYYFCDHKLQLLKNHAHITVDGRLNFHITLYCEDCGEEHTVRGRFPPSHSNESRAALVKLLVLSYYWSGCVNQKIYKV